MRNKKKYTLILLIVLLIQGIALAQFGGGVRRLKDPHIVAQEKRQVFQQWGNWLPAPKYFLGIQTSVNHALVWGWMSPDRNQDYRKGPDIRPLSPTGLQNQRYASTYAQEQQTRQILEFSNSVYNEAVSEFAHNEGVLSPTDPLYQLYYKRMLSPLENFDVESSYYTDWGFKSQSAYNEARRTKSLDKIKEKIEVTQEKYTTAKKMDMPRGKRLLQYHECLLEWRKHMTYLAYITNQQEVLQQSKERRRRIETSGTIERNRTDADIFAEIIMGSNLK